MQTEKKETVPFAEEARGIVLNDRLRDSSSKIIFDDSVLCAQFLKDYVDGLKDVEIQPEYIEDVSERYVPLIAQERYSDTVKRIKIPNKTALYFITLIEHKSEVDYNVGMQIFRYIYQIWEDYEKEMEATHKGISKGKGFQYPPVIPIVYYEGKERWTAPLEFKERISMHEMFGDMIPNFTYQLVRLNDYSNEELLDKGDAISLMMLLNKIRNHADVEQFMRLPIQRLEEIVSPMPEYLVNKIAQIFRVCLFAMNTPEAEVEEIVSRVEEKNMARLFEGMEVDIQADRQRRREEEQRIAEGRQELEEGRQELEEGRQELEEGRQELEEGRQELEEGRQRLEEDRQLLREQQHQMQRMKDLLIQNYIQIACMEQRLRSQVSQDIQKMFGLSDVLATEKLDLYWKE